jgi:hypothetical protein
LPDRLIERGDVGGRERHRVGQADFLAERQADGARQRQLLLGCGVLRDDQSLPLRLALNPGPQHVDGGNETRAPSIVGELRERVSGLQLRPGSRDAAVRAQRLEVKVGDGQDDLGEQAFAEWRAAGSPRLAWLSPAMAMLVLAAGLRGDVDPWRSRTLEFGGGERSRLAPVTAFVDARLAVHTGDVADAERLVAGAFAEFRQPWHRAYANAAGAELAVLAGLPDATARLEQAGQTARECDWAAACVARARGRLTGDEAATREAREIWQRIGARFELACTGTDRPPDGASQAARAAAAGSSRARR